MTKIAASKVTNMAMVNGNEGLYKVVIDKGIVMEWVGIGWIEIRKANPGDYRKIPEVERT